MEETRRLLLQSRLDVGALDQGEDSGETGRGGGGLKVAMREIQE